MYLLRPIPFILIRLDARVQDIYIYTRDIHTDRNLKLYLFASAYATKLW